MDRRHFISGAAALLLTGAGGALRASADSKRAKVRIAMFGASHSHAAGKLQAVRDLSDEFELLGVVEPDAALRNQLQPLPKFAGVPWLSQEELLELGGDLDSVLVETAVADQARAAQRCIDAGWHVHLEKPGGESHANFARLFESARRRERHIQMGYMLRHNPAFEFCFRAVEEGWLGRVFDVSGSMSKLVDDQQRQEFAGYSGGAMFELGCHVIDALMTVLGIPEQVTAYNRATRGDGVLDNQLAVFEYPLATATVRSSIVEPYGTDRRHFTVSGELGTLEIRPLEPPHVQLTLAKPIHGFKEGHQVIVLPAAAGRYHAQLQEFAAIVRGDHTPRWTREHDLAVHRAVLQASGVSVSGS